MPKGVFSGLLICVSGAFDGMSQNEVKAAVTKNGGKISTTCTKTTDYVLAAALGTGKAGRAEELGIPVVGQAWLEACIEDGVISTKASHYHFKPDGGKATAKPTARARTGKDDDDDGDGDGSDDDAPKKKKKPAAAAAAATKKSAKKMKDSDGEADSGDDDDDGPKSGRKRKAPTSGGGSGVFEGLTFAVSGRMSRSQAEVKTLLAKHGGTLAGSVTASVTHCLAEDLGSSKTLTAARSGRPVVRESWLDDCIAQGKVLKDDKYYVANSPSGKIGKNGGAAAGGKGKGSGDDDDDDEDDEPPKKKAKTVKKAKKKDDDDDDDGDDDDDDAPKAKKSSAKSAASGSDSGLKKVVLKGAVAVDDGCPGARDGHVLQEKGVIWDALLNQTNIANNNNKFYVIQVIESDKGGSYYVWNRWGRVGAKGQNKYEPHGSNLENAKRSFRSKFREKTKNDWDTVAARPDSFRAASGKYTVLFRDTTIADNADDEGAGAAGDDGEEDDGEKKKDAKKKQKVDSTLDPRVQSLVSLISDKSMMEKQMVEIGFDPKRMPLGKLSKETINRGYLVLKKISDELEGKANNAKLVELSNQFYTLVPHNFGMTVPPVIKTEKMLKDKLAMVEALADIEIATKLLGKEGKGDDLIHPIDAAYLKLKCKMTAVDKAGNDAPEFDLIKQYVANTHAATHTAYALEVEEVFRLERDGEEARFSAWKDNENRQLLWHGSRLTNFVGILSQGLRIAPPEAPVTGYMFGKGVYFADMVSKSANYCCTSHSSNTGCLLLCEVALGKERPLYAADYYADQLPAGTHSTKGVGTTHPDPAGAQQLLNGCKVPCGKGTTFVSPHQTSLLYNEFIVYDTAQITMRYLVRMKFHYK